jgi:Cu+-exporting ATPase
MTNKLIQVKASGMMCSFCTMSVEKALKRLDGVENVQVNLVHGIILVEGDPARVSQEQVARKVEELSYTVVAAVVLLWIGYPILRKTLMAVGQRVINANVLLSAGAWGAFGIGVAHLFAPTEWPNFFPVAIWLMALHLFFGYFKLGTRKAAAESVPRSRCPWRMSGPERRC